MPLCLVCRCFTVLHCIVAIKIDIEYKMLLTYKTRLTQNVAFFRALMTIDVSIWKIRTSICGGHNLLASRRFDFGRRLISSSNELRFLQDRYRSIVNRDAVRELAFTRRGRIGGKW